MRLPIDYSDERQLRAAFSYMTRIGAAPKFGTRPISYYQQHQCHALDVLQEALGGSGKVRTKGASIQGKRDDEKRWRFLMTADRCYEKADARY